MRRLLLFFSFFLIVQPLWAWDGLVKGDSTVQRIKKAAFYFALDVRRSFVRDVPVRISGLKIGITIRKNHSVGVGYYNMGRPIFNDVYISNPVEYDEDHTLYSRRQSSNVDIHTRIKLSAVYTSLFYEHRFLSRRKWNMDITGQYGFGHVYISAYDKRNGRLIQSLSKKDFIQLLEASISVQYKIVNWLGAGAGVGYRYMINPNEYISTTFNYPIWTVKLILFPTKLVPVFKGEKKWYE